MYFMASLTLLCLAHTSTNAYKKHETSVVCIIVLRIIPLEHSKESLSSYPAILDIAKSIEKHK